MADYDNVWDPALLGRLMPLSGIPDEQALARQLMEFGREDSRTEMPKGYHVGGTYIAASPLEHLAAGLQRAMGTVQQRKAAANIQDLIGKQVKGRNALAEALGRRMTPPEPEYAGPVEAPQLIK